MDIVSIEERIFLRSIERRLNDEFAGQIVINELKYRFDLRLREYAKNSLQNTGQWSAEDEEGLYLELKDIFGEMTHN